MTDSKVGTQDEHLNDSWVELEHYQNQGMEPPSGGMSSGETSVHSIHNGNMERLLMEAQRETSSKGTSRASSRGSPRSPHSPNNELASQDLTKEIVASDWIWDWSSRPDANPPSEWKFKHPKSRRHKLSVRNTRVMRNGVFRMENLPTLLLTHACTFFLGAATMFIYLKKYCNWSPPKIVTIPMD